MLKKLLGYDFGFMQAMDAAGNFLCVSALWIACCLPVFTAGTSTAALYYAVTKSVRKGHGYAAREFWDFFKKNWKQGAGVSLVYIGLAALAVLEYQIVAGMSETLPFAQVYRVISLWIGFAVLALGIYVFPVFSRFVYGIGDTFKTAFVMSWKHLFSTILMLAVAAAGVFLCTKIALLIVLVPGMTAYFISLRMEGVFRQYMEKPKEGEDVPWYWES